MLFVTNAPTMHFINNGWIQPGAGFPTHGHQDMEIITYVLEGTLKHQDNLGNGSIIYPGDVQKMSAGTGILHIAILEFMRYSNNSE